MKIKNCILLLRSGLGNAYKILFFSITCFTSSAYSIGDSAEAIWWADMHTRAALKKDENGRVFAIEVQLTNRSPTDIALIDHQVPPIIYKGLIVSIQEIGPGVAMEALGEWLTINRTAIEIQHSHLAQEANHRKAAAYLEILPNKKHTFCINLHAYLMPKAVLNPLKRYALTVNFGNMLAWKRRSGYTTDFGMESYANIHNALATQNTKSPYFDFSPQQLVAHKNRSCG